jgi:predicted dehydrogenase
VKTVGIVGCGSVFDTYAGNAPRFAAAARLVACADRTFAKAEARARAHGLRALTVEALLADPGIDIVLNLTSPAAHAPIGRAAIAAGKHVYQEKPLAATFADGQALVAAARAAGVQLAAAPDTLLGAAHQAARRLVDGGAIGRIVGASATVMNRGMEHWHENPAFFFRAGGGPLLDLGPYYAASLVALLGPARRVAALGAIGFGRRTVGRGPRAGDTIAVEVPTTVQAAIEFDGGAVVALAASWDVQRHGHAPIELYGSAGTLVLPDPNFFGGVLRRADGEDRPWHDEDTAGAPLGAPNRPDGSANHRYAGVADLARAIEEHRPPRLGADFALHVLELLEGAARAAAEGRTITLGTRCERPPPLPDAEAASWLGGQG